MRRPPRFVPFLLTLSLSLATAGPAAAGPTLGFVENFSTAGSTAGWLSGAENTNPGTGGIGGAEDGYLRIARSLAAQLGSHNSDPDYTGDYIAAGAQRIKFSLNDVGANQNLEIHFAIGNQGDFWLYTPGFIPPENSWAEFTVEFSDSANFTPIIQFSPGNFSQALALVDRVQIRHDVSPFTQMPNSLAGEFGVDGFKIEGTPVGIEPVRPGRPRAVALAAPFPNPSRGTAIFAYETFDESPVTIAVVDARGRLLRKETLAASAIGRHSWTWDGRDGEGRKLAAGVYRVRAFSPAGGMSRPVVLIE